MALPEPRIVSLDELRFRPANSNERARAGLEHAFTDVPPCSFARDDGISHYMGAASGIGGFPDAHLNQPALHDDVPLVAHETVGFASAMIQKLGRAGFGLSVFLHAVVAIALGYFATVSLPDDALLAGETIISLELLSDSEVDAQSAGDEAQVVEPEEKPVEQEVVEKPKVEQKVAEPERPVEEARLPEPVERPAERIEPVVTTEVPEVLATDQPSSFAVEEAARTILDTTEIEPLPLVLPKELVAPLVEQKPETRLAQPLAHPISKPDPRLEPKPVVKKPEPKVGEKTPGKKKPAERSKKVKGNKGADGSDSTRGATDPRNKGKQNQDASQGDRKNREIGNAATSNYKGLVQRKLERAKKRVRVAGKGSVIVSFTITASGGVTGLKIRKSSGKPAIDKGALDVVRKASPFPAIPPEAKRSSWSMSVPMTFK